MSTKKENKHKFSKSDFFTKEKAENGLKLPLELPTGEATEHWIKIISADADAYRKAEREASVQLLKSVEAISDKKKRREAIDKKSDELQLEVTASLVIGWSFEDEECNKENVIDMLRNAPNIRAQIENIAVNKKEVFYKLSALS